RRSSNSSSCKRTFLSASERLPPPTTTGTSSRWYSSTRPASIAWGAGWGPPRRAVAVRSCLQLPDRFGVELSLDPSPGARHRLQRLRIDDLLSRLPDLGEVLHGGRLHGQVAQVLPGDHRLVHPPPEKVGAGRPHEVVYEGVHLLVRLGPIEGTVRVLDVAAHRRDRVVDQLGHAGPRARTAQSGYSSFRHERGSAGWGFGVRSSRKLKYGTTNGSGADTV